MAKGIGTPTPSSVLVHRLRLMADAGGMLTRDRTRTVIEAADRIDGLCDQIEELRERIDIMTAESDPLPPGATDFPPGR